MSSTPCGYSPGIEYEPFCINIFALVDVVDCAVYM